MGLADRRAETILVAEDDPAILMLVRAVLEAAGFRVLPAHSAREARLLAAGFPGTVHLLLTDVMMPDTTGPELAKYLQEQRPDLRVILMSGHADESILAQNPDWQFLNKPFVTATLLDRVNDALRREADPTLDSGIPL